MPEAIRGYTIQAGVTLHAALQRAIDDWRASRPRIASRSEAIRILVQAGLSAESQPLRTKVEPFQPQQILLPPPTPKPHTLTELVALIRETAETNPFVRPLADMLEGKV